MLEFLSYEEVLLLVLLDTEGIQPSRIVYYVESNQIKVSRLIDLGLVKIVDDMYAITGLGRMYATKPEELED